MNQPQLKGMLLSHAMRLLKENDIDWRIVKRDKEDYVVTADCKGDRLNLEIENDRVIKTYLG